MGKIKITGGAYRDREGLTAEIIGENIVITGWYDGGVELDVEINMPFREFIQRLTQHSPFEFIRKVRDGEHHHADHPDEPCQCNEIAAAKFLQNLQTSISG